MKKQVTDPDFGPLEVPPPPDRGEFEEAVREALRAAAGRRLWPTGSIGPCPRCGKEAFVGRDDLSHAVVRPGSVLVFKHLRGGRCGSCEAQCLEPADLAAVEQEAGVEILADFEAKVSHIGSGTLGTYWPKDIVRNLDLSPDKRAFIQVLDRETALIRFKPGTKKPAQGAKPSPSRRVRREKKAALGS